MAYREKLLMDVVAPVVTEQVEKYIASVRMCPSISIGTFLSILDSSPI